MCVSWLIDTWYDSLHMLICMMLLSLVCVKGLLMALKEVVVCAIVCILFLLIPRLFHTHTQRPVDGTFSVTNAHTLCSIITHSLTRSSTPSLTLTRAYSQVFWWRSRKWLCHRAPPAPLLRLSPLTCCVRSVSMCVGVNVRVHNIHMIYAHTHEYLKWCIYTFIHLRICTCIYFLAHTHHLCIYTITNTQIHTMMNTHTHMIV